MGEMSGISSAGVVCTNVRPVLTWVPSEDLAALDVAMMWHRLVRDSVPGATCVWTTRPLDRPIDHLAATALCWHVVELPERLDRHLPNSDGRAPWSPWGPKSGPNHQFFSILDALRDEHPEEWALFIEPDTYPVGVDVAAGIDAVVDAHPDAWMIGGVPHPHTRPSLARDLWHHVNGAALYHVADADFARFRTRVWIPTLLLRIRSEPRYAFDCATDPTQWNQLPSSLREPWQREARKFVRTAGVINLSSMTISADQVAGFLAEPSRYDGCDDNAEPWMLHAKGDLARVGLEPTPVSRPVPSETREKS